MGDVAGAVIGHHGLTADAAVLEPGDRAFEKGDGRRGSFVGQDLGVGHARGIVDGNVDELPADASNASGAISMDAMADTADPAQLLDIDVDQLTWAISLIPQDWLLGLEAFEASQTVTGQDPGNRRVRKTHPHGDLRTGVAAPAQPDHLLDPIRMNLLGHPIGSGTAIHQRRLASLSMPSSPLPSTLAAQTGRLGGAGHRRTCLDPLHQQQSTGRATSGILVKLQLGSSSDESVALDTSSLTDRDPDGQLTYVNNVLRNHI